MPVKDLRLNCRRCGAFTEYHRKRDDPRTVIRCDGCGKRHSKHAIHMVDVGRSYRRDESGALLEDVV